MNILAIGDVVGTQGCEFLRHHLPAIKRLKEIDICIANGENSAAGNGITPTSATHLLESGVDFITTGNHAFRRHEVYEYFNSDAPIIRPANYHHLTPGRGYDIIDKGRYSVAVINLAGTVYMEGADNPFDKADELLKELQGIKTVIVDFHAEATAEKRAMGFYLDGRVTALFGTHTHVQTSDACILPKGTAYITDLGMTGPVDSVLGVEPALAIEKLRTGMPVRFENPAGRTAMNACIFTIDEKTGKALSVEAITIE
ncbi:MAG: TIGR00282 family metallophosphoesterase [Clostridiales bacterium]|nr:TIGR00282 family metallophosphoesterase [Clostridiales bacterium]